MTRTWLRALLDWWRADFDFTWIPEFLERRSLTLQLRWVIGATCLILGFCAGLLLISRQGPTGTVPFWVLVVTGLSCIYAGVRWPMAPWPTEARSLLFLAWADPALTMVVWFGIRDAAAALPACGVFAISGLYATLLHSPRVIVGHLVFALGASGWVFARAMSAPGADIAFLTAESILVVGVILFPVGLHAALQVLKQDAATSHHDPLTELLNRRGLADRIDHVADRDGSALVTVLLDLDGFKEINDAHGHDAGDAALRALAERLTTAAPIGALVGRLGGDEFAVIYAAPELEVGEGIDAVRTATSADGSGLSASVGVWIETRPDVPAPGDLFYEVIKRADFAMYEAKRSGMGLVVHRG